MINRRTFIGSSAFALAGAALVRRPLFALPQQTPPTPKFEDLRGGVGVFTASGGAIGWLVTPDGAVAVDSQYMTTAPACIDGLKQRSPKGIQILINTHHHGDHVQGNPAFRPLVKNIVQNEKCAQYHKSTTANPTAANPPAQAYADVTFGASWSTTIGAEKVWAKHNGAGHTGGDAVIIFEKANVVHMGDLMFNRMHPFIDRVNGASIKSWVNVLKKVTDDHKDALYIFGHAQAGKPITGPASEVLHFRNYLSAVLDHAQKGVSAGKPLAEITAIQALPGFEDFPATTGRLSLSGALGVAYEELTAK